MSKLSEETENKLGKYEDTSLPEYIELVFREYEMEKEKKTSLETRAGLIFGFISVLIIFLFEKLNLNTLSSSEITTQKIIIVVLATLICIVSLWTLFWLIMILTTREHSAFEISSINDNSIMRNKILEQAEVIKSYVNVVVKIRQLNEKKSKYLKIALWSSFLLTILILILVIIK